jgi:hypothetical protein
MAEPPINERRFTDREVREILKRAAERRPTQGLTVGRGLSLAELQSIGKEVGIDPSQLEEVARSVVLQSELSPHPFLGVPTVVRSMRTVEGQLDPTQTAAVLSTIRNIMGRHGEVSEVGGSLEWRTKGGSVETLVSVSSRGGGTIVEGSANLRQLAVGTFIPGGIVTSVIALMGIALSIGDTSLSIAGVALSGGFVAAAYAGLRAYVVKAFRSESVKLEAVANAVAELVPTREG